MKGIKQLAREIKSGKISVNAALPQDFYAMDIIGYTERSVMVINSRGFIYYIPSSCEI